MITLLNETRRAPEWLLSAIEDDRHGMHDEASDAVFDHIDEMLAAGAVEEIDSLFTEEVAALGTPDVLLALLTSTAELKKVLPKRKAWIPAAQKQLVSEGYDETVTRGL